MPPDIPSPAPLSENKLERLLGQSIASFNAKCKTSLDLSGGGLTSLPEALGQLQSLTYLNLRGNRLTSLPETVKRALKELKKRGCSILGIKI